MDSILLRTSKHFFIRFVYLCSSINSFRSLKIPIEINETGENVGRVVWAKRWKNLKKKKKTISNKTNRILIIYTSEDDIVDGMRDRERIYIVFILCFPRVCNIVRTTESPMLQGINTECEYICVNDLHDSDFSWAGNVQNQGLDNNNKKLQRKKKLLSSPTERLASNLCFWTTWRARSHCWSQASQVEKQWKCTFMGNQWPVHFRWIIYAACFHIVIIGQLAR